MTHRVGRRWVLALLGSLAASAGNATPGAAGAAVACVGDCDGTAELNLAGSGVLESQRLPPTLDDIVLCGGGPPDRACNVDEIRNGTQAGYIVTLFAVPETIPVAVH